MRGPQDCSSSSMQALGWTPSAYSDETLTVAVRKSKVSWLDQQPSSASSTFSTAAESDVRVPIDYPLPDLRPRRPCDGNAQPKQNVDEVQYETVEEELSARRNQLSKTSLQLDLLAGEFELLIKMVQIHQKESSKALQDQMGAMFRKITKARRLPLRTAFIAEYVPPSELKAQTLLATVNLEINAIQGNLQQLQDAMDYVHSWLAVSAEIDD